MVAPRTDSAAVSRTSRTPKTPKTAAASARHLLATPIPALAWVALLLAPVLWVIELSGPRWLNLTLRGVWVAVVVVIAGLMATRWTATRRMASRAHDDD